MKVGIMQPYFVPYLGYFSLMKHTKEFILLDTVQFIRHGWIERNRILKPSNEWQYIGVPLRKHSRDTLIKDIRINQDSDWRERILRQLEHYKKRAPYYSETIELLKLGLQIESDSIVKLNERMLNLICDYIEIEVDINVFSEMDLVIKEVSEPDDWALHICQSLENVNQYVNPIGGRELFCLHKYKEANIDIAFHCVNLTPYSQQRPCFQSGLSIIDVLMFNEPQKIREMLDNYSIIESTPISSHSSCESVGKF